MHTEPPPQTRWRLVVRAHNCAYTLLIGSQREPLVAWCTNNLTTVNLKSSSKAMCHRRIEIKLCGVCGTEATPIAFNVIPCGYPPQTSPPAHNTPTCPGIIDDLPEHRSYLCNSCHNKWVLVEAYKANEQDKEARKHQEEERQTKAPIKEDAVDKFFRELEEQGAAKAAAAASRNNNHASDDETEWEDIVTF
ncbi:hypothetical protein CEP54_003666 [Fusarium duplospermum]|uniref:Uncharacterized protein n=1 Tax=Fusarium duplospermum TaxID=1325734 RepID=A0A428QMM0_9HYPO|nr:hypothetical protein CEP54_003666 [Fusarium duplospermum]